MGLLYCKYSDENDRVGKVDRNGGGSYTILFDVLMDEDEVGPVEVVQAARAAGGSNDTMPPASATYSFLNSADLSSYFNGWEAKLKYPKENYRLWQIKLDYAPLESGETSQKRTEPNPLNWTPEYWIEWVEEQVPLEEATCVTDLPQISRGPSFPGEEPGPIVNACGQQTIDPLMKTVFHPIVCSIRNLPGATGLQDIIDINEAYQETTNDDTFLGMAARKWRYLITSGDRLQERNVEGVGKVTFIPATTKIELRDATWDRPILNNGLLCFKKDGGDYISTEPVDSEDIQKILFEILVMKRDNEGTEEEVPASEPVNLALDGTKNPPDSKATFVSYRHLLDADYDAMGF